MVRGSEESEPSDNMASLLDRYDEIQRRPLGTNTALSAGNTNNLGGVAGSQFRRQEAAYGQALRTLNRAARRGDARAGLQALEVRKEAMGAGFAPGGIRRSEIANAGIRGQVAGLQQDTAERAKQSRILQMQTDESMGGIRVTTPAPPSGSFQAVGEFDPATGESRNPAETPAAGAPAAGAPAAKAPAAGAPAAGAPAAGTPAAPVRRSVPLPIASYETSGGSYTGRTPSITGAAAPAAATTPAPKEKTPAQKYAEAQEAYQKGFKTEDDTQNTRFAAMNRIYSGADSQGQADIVAQSLKRAAGLEKTATPAPTKRTSRINRRK